MQYVGEIITDDLHPSVYESLLIPISVANSVGNKKKTSTVLQTNTRDKIFFSRGNITDGLNPSEFSTVITDG